MLSLSRRHVLLGAAASATLQASAAPILVKKESRLIYSEGPSWIGQTNAWTLCDRVKKAGFNVLMACPWHGTGVSWPSQVCPAWDNNPKFQANYVDGLDPLGLLIQTAHAFGLEVHVVFTVMQKRRHGTDFFPGFEPKAKYPKDAFDLRNAEFRDFFVALVKEVVTNYPIDGLNLDYIRVGDGAHLNADWIAQYRDTTGRDLVQDYNDLLSDAKSGTTQHPEARALIDWQETVVGDIVKRVGAIAPAGKPFSVHGRPFDPLYAIQGRVPEKWLANRNINLLYEADYELKPDWNAIRARMKLLSRPSALVPMVANWNAGSPVTPRTPKEVANLLFSVERQIAPPNGTALYLYEQLTDDQITQLAATTHRQAATPYWVLA